MLSPFYGWSRVTPLVACLLLIVAIGCGQPVREDRTVEFARDGQTVAFQHGQEGVYVANPDGNGVTQIFAPDPTVLGTGRPLSSPTDGRLIFTTAHRPDGSTPPTPVSTGPLPAEGRVDWQQPVRYRCWLRDAPDGKNEPVVKELFQADCDHIGYVTAGLAVRWTPDGQRIVYVGSDPSQPQQHFVLEFDLATGKSRRVFPHAAPALIFDFTPQGTALVCVVGPDPSHPAAHESAAAAQLIDSNGVWIGQPGDDASWWHVPDTHVLADGELRSVLESLRASRPAWTSDDQKFAFVSGVVSPANGTLPTHRLKMGELATRKVTTLNDIEGTCSDLRWAPDGQQVGYLKRTGTAPPVIELLRMDGTTRVVPGSEWARRFAGFDRTGRELAWVSPGVLDGVKLDDLMQTPDLSDSSVIPEFRIGPPGARWAALLSIDPFAWDRVRVAASDGLTAGRVVFSDLRVTFPNWSPTEDRLALWLTFEPRYGSIISLVGRGGLWPGDPAATLNTQTGEVAWMAVNPEEQLQVGHFLQLQNQPDAAWKWYSRAREALPETVAPQDWNEFAQRVGSPANGLIFEAICLDRLGRQAEAAATWKTFDASFFPAAPAAKPATGGVSSLLGAALEADQSLLPHFVHDLYVAQVFLSLDRLADGIAYFRRPLPADISAGARFSREVVLGQLLLLQGDNAAYVTHATQVIAPAGLKYAGTQSNPRIEAAIAFEGCGGLGLLPLFQPEFLADVPDDLVRETRASWEKFLQEKPSESAVVAIHLVLRACSLRLQDSAAADAAEKVLQTNPAAQRLFRGQSIPTALESYRVMIQWANLSQNQEWQTFLGR